MRVAAASAAGRERGDGHVLEGGEAVEEAHVLERPHNSRARDLVCRLAGDLGAVEEHGARRRAEDARDAVEQGRLPGAVRADQPDDRTLPEAQRNAAERVDPAELLAELNRLERGRSKWRPFAFRRGERAHRPSILSRPRPARPRSNPRCPRVKGLTGEGETV